MTSSNRASPGLISAKIRNSLTNTAKASVQAVAGIGAAKLLVATMPASSGTANPIRR